MGQWIEVAEATLTINRPEPYKNEDNDIQTSDKGSVEVYTFEGAWDTAEGFAMGKMAQCKWPTALGGEGLLGEAVITRKAASTSAVCSVTLSKVIGSQEGSTDANNTPGSSQAVPSVEVAAVMSPQSLLLDPKFDGLSDADMTVLNMICKGAASGDVIFNESNQKTTISSYVSARALKKYVRECIKTPIVLVAETTVTVTYRGSGGPIEANVKPTIVDKIQGVEPLPGEMNFLMVGKTAIKSGNITEIKEVYKVSGVEGWSKTLYP